MQQLFLKVEHGLFEYFSSMPSQVDRRVLARVIKIDFPVKGMWRKMERGRKFVEHHSKKVHWIFKNEIPRFKIKDFQLLGSRVFPRPVLARTRPTGWNHRNHAYYWRRWWLCMVSHHPLLQSDLLWLSRKSWNYLEAGAILPAKFGPMFVKYLQN